MHQEQSLLRAMGTISQAPAASPNSLFCNLKNETKRKKKKKKTSDSPSKTNSGDLLHPKPVTCKGLKGLLCLPLCSVLQSCKVEVSSPSLASLIKINIVVATATLTREKGHPLEAPLRVALDQTQHRSAFPEELRTGTGTTSPPTWAPNLGGASEPERRVPGLILFNGRENAALGFLPLVQSPTHRQTRGVAPCPVQQGQHRLQGCVMPACLQDLFHSWKPLPCHPTTAHSTRTYAQLCRLLHDR